MSGQPVPIATPHEDLSVTKNDIELAETASKGDGADPALKIIGDERVEVTEEDVSAVGPDSRRVGAKSYRMCAFESEPINTFFRC